MSADGYTAEPVTAVDHAAHKGMLAVEDTLISRGARASHVLVLISAEGTPEGEPNATLAGHGFEPEELLAELVSHAQQCADAMGLAIDMSIRVARRVGSAPTDPPPSGG